MGVAEARVAGDGTAMRVGWGKAAGKTLAKAVGAWTGERARGERAEESSDMRKSN